MNAINPAEIRFGLDTFGGMSVKLDGTPETAAQVIRDIVEQAKLADELGLSNFNVGEHHRDDFAVSAPDRMRSEPSVSRRPAQSVATSAQVCSTEPDESRVSVGTCKVMRRSNLPARKGQVPECDTRGAVAISMRA